jgi:hypothetical protein
VLSQALRSMHTSHYGSSRPHLRYERLERKVSDVIRNLLRRKFYCKCRQLLRPESHNKTEGNYLMLQLQCLFLKNQK